MAITIKKYSKIKNGNDLKSSCQTFIDDPTISRMLKQSLNQSKWIITDNIFLSQIIVDGLRTHSSNVTLKITVFSLELPSTILLKYHFVLCLLNS